MDSPGRVSLLGQDAGDLYDAATAFIRIYQFRDRHHALRSGLTVVQAYTLDALLSAGSRSLKGLASDLRLDKSTTSRVISGMAQRGLVKWSRSEHDRRAKVIAASAEGRLRYHRLRRRIIRSNARLLAAYPRSARRAAISLLWRLAQRAGSPLAASSRRSGSPGRPSPRGKGKTVTKRLRG